MPNTSTVNRGPRSKVKEKMEAGAMLIGELAETTGVSRDTIRYYEKAGLLDPACRLENNYRDYPADSPRRVRFVKQMQAMGFTICGIRELLELRRLDPITCGAVSPHVSRRLTDIDAALAELTAMRDEIGRFFARCGGSQAADRCTPLERGMRP